MEDLKMEKGSLVEENTSLKKELYILNENKVSIRQFNGRICRSFPFFPQEKLTAQCSKMEQIQSENQKLRSHLEDKISLSEDLCTKVELSR